LDNPENIEVVNWGISSTLGKGMLMGFAIIIDKQGINS